MGNMLTKSALFVKVIFMLTSDELGSYPLVYGCRGRDFLLNFVGLIG